MTHEFKDIVTAYLMATEKGLKTVLATVVDLDGSSYRKPGVRMLLLENGEMIGAVSGGCVEKDIARKAMSVFEDGKSKMMIYDGRFRLGCEGVLYILIEIFKPNDSFVSDFSECLNIRKRFKFDSYYRKEEGVFNGIGTFVELQELGYSVSDIPPQESAVLDSSILHFTQTMRPCFKLMIFGAEHDAVQLCTFASLNGWEVTVVSGPMEPKTIDNFPGATDFYSASPDMLELSKIDDQTAIVLMSHNFANDLKFLIELKDTSPAYLGLLGPAHRREKLLSQLIDYIPDVDEKFIDLIHGPAGLNIGAETPQEIAVSILSEILSVVRDKKPILLKEKEGGIHA
ncbi:MAG: xanthine dehydrogenase accessory factor [Flavobacteriaceae bacterium]|jgi:xanthine/CO dehydrogenase XdhC/CoxF family maturation factor